MGRHSVQAGESFGVVIDPDKMPLPGSRRAARLAALAQTTASSPIDPAGDVESRDRESEKRAQNSQTLLSPSDASDQGASSSTSRITFVEAVLETSEETAVSQTADLSQKAAEDSQDHAQHADEPTQEYHRDNRNPENLTIEKTETTPLLSVVAEEDSATLAAQELETPEITEDSDPSSPQGNNPGSNNPTASENKPGDTDTTGEEDKGDNATALNIGSKAPKRPFFSLFNRSRAVVVALVAAASGVAAAGTASLTPRSADAEPLTISGVSAADTMMLPTNFSTQGTSVTFTVTVDGQTRQLTTTTTTLYEALREAGIVIDDDDKVSQLVQARVYDGANVVITRVEKKTSVEEVADVHTSSEVEDDTLTKGQKKVETKGVDGLTVNTYEVVYEDGQEVSRRLLISSAKVQRVDEVVKVGTREEKEEKNAVDTSGAVAVPAGDSQQIAHGMLGSYGWDDSQFTCLASLWNKESKWNHLAQNRSSGAYGIPQALPGSKMASAGADWATNPATQIRWGLGYISGRYGSPCGAWAHSQRVGWY